MWFWQLDRTRNGNGYAADRLGYADVRALAGDRPADWEIEAILAMDTVRLKQDVDAPIEADEPLMPGMIEGR